MTLQEEEEEEEEEEENMGYALTQMWLASLLYLLPSWL
jgi:hypothetical protein